MATKEEPDKRHGIVVFLDRDGTINRNFESGPIYNTERFELLPGAAAAIRELNKLNVPVVIVTNQGGINHREHAFSWEVYEQIEELMHQYLEEEAGAYVDGVFLCEHADYEKCECRKPKIGMFQQAAKEHTVMPERSFMVGDSAVDILAGKAFGLQSILVTSGWATGVAEELREQRCEPDRVVADLGEAVSYIREVITAAEK